MIRLRATKHQRTRPKPGGSSDTTQPRATTSAYSCALARRVRDVGAAASTATTPPGRLQRAGVRGGVDAERQPGHHRHAGGRQAAPERARDLEAVRRGAAGADDRHRVRPSSASSRPARAAPRAGRPARAAGPGRRRRSGTPARARARAAVSAGARPRRSPRTRARPPQAPSASSSSSGSASTRAVTSRWRHSTSSCPDERRDERGAPQARVAGGHGRDAASARGGAASGRSRGRHAAAASAADSRRRPAARMTCSGPTVSLPSRSAIVRATRRTRPWPRALRRWRSWSS